MFEMLLRVYGICQREGGEEVDSARAGLGQLTILPMLPASPSIPARPLCPWGEAISQ